MFKRLLMNRSKKKEAKNQSSDFDKIMSFAHSVFETYERKSTLHNSRRMIAETHPIIDMIRLLGRKLQTEYLMSLLYFEDESSLEGIYFDETMFDTKQPITIDGKFFRDLLKNVSPKKELLLGRDLLLPWPWKRSRFIDCITNIGKGRLSGEWKQDANNHYVELWLPIGVAWVTGGNHSISTGIIQGNGVLEPTTIYDISEVYNHVYTDGLNFLRKRNNSIISPVSNIEFAAIFEIGRIMKEKSISF